jgi:Flp pilus assembly protein TadB
MFLTHRIANAFGFISLGILIIVFVLRWGGILPEYLFMPIFLVALALFLLRLTIRLIIARRDRLGDRKEDVSVQWTEEGPEEEKKSETTGP